MTKKIRHLRPPFQRVRDDFFLVRKYMNTNLYQSTTCQCTIIILVYNWWYQRFLWIEQNFIQIVSRNYSFIDCRSLIDIADENSFSVSFYCATILSLMILGFQKKLSRPLKVSLSELTNEYKDIFEFLNPFRGLLIIY